MRALSIDFVFLHTAVIVLCSRSSLYQAWLRCSSCRRLPFCCFPRCSMSKHCSIVEGVFYTFWSITGYSLSSLCCCTSSPSSVTTRLLSSRLRCRSAVECCGVSRLLAAVTLWSQREREECRRRPLRRLQRPSQSGPLPSEPCLAILLRAVNTLCALPPIHIYSVSIHIYIYIHSVSVIVGAEEDTLGKSDREYL